MPIARSILSRPWHYIVVLGASLGTGFWRFPRQYDLDSARQPRNKERETRSARMGSSIVMETFDSYPGAGMGMASGEDELELNEGIEKKLVVWCCSKWKSALSESGSLCFMFREPYGKGRWDQLCPARSIILQALHKLSFRRQPPWDFLNNKFEPSSVNSPQPDSSIQ